MAVVSWVGVLGWLGFVFLGTARELSALEPQLEQSRAENKRFKAFLAEKRHQETIRDSLVAQIGTIRTVDGDRYVWPHLLDEVTRALPAYTWLVDIGPAGVSARPALPPRPRRAPPRAAKPGDKAGLGSAGRRRRGAVRGERAHGGHPGLHPVPPPARGLALDHRRDRRCRRRRWSRRSGRSRRSPSGPRTSQADSAYIRTVPLSQSVR